MNIKQFGWENYLKSFEKLEKISQENVARVALENRGSYLLYSEIGELTGILRGKFVKFQKLESQYPKVGDWVVFEKLPGEQKAIIESVLPRKSKISRKKAGDDLDEQIIATNVEIVFIVQGLDYDFNLGRLERYVAMSREGGCEPVILLNKSDVVVDAGEIFARVSLSFPGVKIFLTSAKNGEGLEDVREIIKAGESLVFVGSSGAGKSTLINKLIGVDRQKIGEIREDDSKGKHTTTKRELILLESGGVLFDTPGMRELGMWAASDAVTEAFDDINVLTEKCKFNDCDHQFSKGCAVIEAVGRGEVSDERYQRFLKIKNELDPMEARRRKNLQQAEKRSFRKSTKRSELKRNK